MVVVDEGKLSGNRSQGVEWGRVTEAQPGVCRRGKSREWQSRDEVERRSRARVVEGGYIMYKARREKIPFAGERQRVNLGGEVHIPQAPISSAPDMGAPVRAHRSLFQSLLSSLSSGSEYQQPLVLVRKEDLQAILPLHAHSPHTKVGHSQSRRCSLPLQIAALLTTAMLRSGRTPGRASSDAHSDTPPAVHHKNTHILLSIRISGQAHPVL